MFSLVFEQTLCILDEVLPTIHRTGTYSVKKTKDNKPDVKEMNARVRMSNQYLKLANSGTFSETYKNLLIAKSAEILAGEEIIPLPRAEQKMHTAQEVGAMFNVSAQKVGRVANANNLKTEEYGEWYHDKSPYSPKEVDAFRYNDKAIEEFRKLLK